MAYTYRRSITIDATKAGGATHTDFPVLVAGTYTYLKTTANGGEVQHASGHDVAFFSDAALTTQLKHEVERYVATTGEVVYWVKVPSLSHTVDTVIYIAYGDAGISGSQADAVNVWTNAFETVWHTPDGTTLSLGDSTSNGNAGSNEGTATAAAGKVGGAVELNGTSQFVRGTNAGVTGMPLTMSGWFNADALGSASTIATLIADANDVDWYRLHIGTGSALMLDTLSGADGYDSTTSSTTLSTATWYFGAAVFTSATQRELFLNGATQGTATANKTPQPFTLTRFTAGRFDRLSPGDYFDGKLDEVRLASAARSAGWLLAEYNNQGAPATFYAVGSQEAVGGGGGPDAATLRRYRQTCLLMVQ